MRDYLLALATLMIATVAATANGSLIRFDWTDDLGSDGYFIWDTDIGFSTAAISEFSYIFDDGTPTPPGFIPVAFNTSSSGGNQNWDLRIASEGVSLNFDTVFNVPLPDAPATYESAFMNGNYLALPTGLRTWNQISVTAVPEPSMLPLYFAGTFFLAVRVIRKRILSGQQ